MTKTKIEWADYSWNPIKGVCPVGCFYCYARKMYQRFKWGPELRLDYAEINIPFPHKSSRIFVCSMMEVFHPKVKPEWRRLIFEMIESPAGKEHTFIILTKLPERIDRAMPENAWLGTSVEGAGLWRRARELAQKRARIKFISFEPLTGSLPAFSPKFDWYIVGKLTGHGHRFDPTKEQIQTAVNQARKQKRPIFLKNNLREIWGEPLIQEFPR